MINVVMTSVLAGALPWLLGYLFHSTIWIGGAHLVCGRGGGRGARGWLGAQARNTIWRMAVVGPFVSLALAAAAGAAGSGWTVHTVHLGVAPPARVETPAPVDLGATGRQDQTLAPRAAAGDQGTGAAAAPRAAAAGSPAGIWIWSVFAAALVVALLRLGLLGRDFLRLRRRLAGRRPATDPRLWQLLDELRPAISRRPVVRLTMSDSLSSPVALWHGEICLPTRTAELDRASLSGVLAHELAHIERHDNAWLAIGAVIQALGFFQPLNRLARQAMQESAELAADARAVELTDDPEALARSLAQVAGWGIEPGATLLVSPIVSSPGALLWRVEQLLASRGRRRGGAIGLVVVALLGVLASVSPAVALGPAQGRSTLAPGARLAVRAPVVVAAPSYIDRDQAPAAAPGPQTRSSSASTSTRLRTAGPSRRLALADSEAPAAVVAAPAPASPAPGAPGAEIAFVLVDRTGAPIWVGASADEVREALAAVPGAGEEYLWVRRDLQRLAISAPEALAQVHALIEEQARLGRVRQEIGTTRIALGESQIRIAAAMQELGKQQQEQSAAQAEIDARRAALRAQRIQKDIDLSNDPSKSRPTLGELATLLAMRDEAIRSDAAVLTQKQRDLAAKQRDLAVKQRDLGVKHKELVQKIRELGSQEDEVRRKVRAEIPRIIDESLAHGTARGLSPVPLGPAGEAR